jgi:hypothetical protein
MADFADTTPASVCIVGGTQRKLNALIRYSARYSLQVPVTTAGKILEIVARRAVGLEVKRRSRNRHPSDQNK